MSWAQTSATAVASQVASATEDQMMKQLNDLVSRGILILKVGEPIFLKSADSNEVKYLRKCELVLKDKEYILKLEGTIEDMTKRIIELEECIKTMHTVK